MGELRGDLKIFNIEKGGPEMLPQHRGENLKYLTSKNIKGSFFTKYFIMQFNHWFANHTNYLTSKNIKGSFLQSSKAI